MACGRSTKYQHPVNQVCAALCTLGRDRCGTSRGSVGTDVNVFACGIGAPKEAVARAKALGKTTLALVGSQRHAQAALAVGVDLLVAQGTDAGAHTGPIGTFSLVPQVVDVAGDVPVIAAGGVATGRHIKAALALGAQGVWMGTAWLTSHEHAAKLSPTLVNKLLAARSEDTVISPAPTAAKPCVCCGQHGARNGRPQRPLNR